MRNRARRAHRQLIGLTVLLVVAAAVAAGAAQSAGPPPAGDHVAAQTSDTEGVDLWSLEALVDAHAVQDPADRPEMPSGALGGSEPIVAEDVDDEPTLADEAAARIGDAEPTEVVLPAVGVHAPLIRLGLYADGTMEVPEEDFMEAGWYEYGPRPGLSGPAVIAGHVDSLDGPAVFYDLEHLQPGDEAVVRYDNGETVHFVVERLEQHPKDHFPTEEVYADTDVPELRLVTCGGLFDRAQREYKDNIIAFATLADADG